MDILEYFNLKESPFRMSPDPRFLYFSDQVSEALAKCEYMAKERIGPIYIYGPIGAGKTSILRRLNELLSQDEKNIITYLISPNIKTSNAFLRVVLESFGVKTERSYDQSLKNFETFLIEAHQQGKVPVLLVDEAQNLNRDCLKLVHYLLNFETPTVKLLQVILVGQEELAAKILRFPELASRMFPIAMNAMSADELRKMIAFRWMVAGGKDNPFEVPESDIYKVLFAYTKGLPRDAIKVCDEALRDMMFKGKKQASSEQIEQIAKEMNLTNHG
jgi:general secretion pathway protein A